MVAKLTLVGNLGVERNHMALHFVVAADERLLSRPFRRNLALQPRDLRLVGADARRGRSRRRDKTGQNEARRAQHSHRGSSVSPSEPQQHWPQRQHGRPS